MHQFSLRTRHARQFDGIKRFYIEFDGLGGTAANQVRCQGVHPVRNWLNGWFGGHDVSPCVLRGTDETQVCLTQPWKQRAQTSVAQKKSAPEQDAQIDAEQDVREERAANAGVGSDGTA